MMQQLCRKMLYTVSSNQPALDVLCPPASSVSKLYQRVPVKPDEVLNLKLDPQRAAAAVVEHSAGQQGGQQLLQVLRAASPTLFLIYWHPDATEDATMRWSAFRAGANMVTYCCHAATAALQQVAHQQQQQQQAVSSYCCEWCGLPGLTAAEYWSHQPLYHIDHVNRAGACQICSRHTSNIARHLHDWHAPTGRGPEERTGVFALCIIRRSSDGKFLMTQEYAGAGYWVPGGGVDPGETLTGAAVRECWEEAGVHVQLKGILALESHHAAAWRRVIFWGCPVDVNSEQQQQQQQQQQEQGQDGLQQQEQQQEGRAQACANTAQQQQDQPQEQPGMLQDRVQQQQQQQQLCPCCCPKTLPDFESAGACWVSHNELQQLPLRSPSEPCRWFPALASGEAANLALYNSLEIPAEWQEVFAAYPVV